jgi:hypothetical protein
MVDKESVKARILRRNVLPAIYTCVVFACLFAQTAVRTAEAQAVSSDNTIRNYWPIDAPTRRWDLNDSNNGPNAAKPDLSMVNETLGPGKFIVWFMNPERQITGVNNGEEYRLCDAMGRTWMFLDEYLNRKGNDEPIERPVKSSRILFTIDGAKPVDLMADGTYAACGSTGQPYLLSSDTVQQYRLQIWGYLAKNPQYKWYWDATVSKPALITNNCLHPPQTVKALRVQEAWWSNFAALNGNAKNGAVESWTMGSTGNLGADGMPDGTGVRNGRTVWHAEGQIPYYLTGPPDGRTVRKCIYTMPANG